MQLLPLQASHLFLGYWAAWNWFPLPCQEWEAPWQPPCCFHSAVRGHRLDSCLLHGRSLVISIRYVRGTRGNVSSVIYLLASEPLLAPRARHIMSLAFLHSHSLSCFLWLLIKPSKGYFQRGEAAAGSYPAVLDGASLLAAPGWCSPSLSQSTAELCHLCHHCRLPRASQSPPCVLGSPGWGRATLSPGRPRVPPAPDAGASKRHQSKFNETREKEVLIMKICQGWRQRELGAWKEPWQGAGTGKCHLLVLGSVWHLGAACPGPFSTPGRSGLAR